MADDEPLPPPTPIWKDQPGRFQEAIARSAQAVQEGVPERDPYRMLDVLVNLERNALECARIALKEEGLYPTLAAGRVYWLDLAGVIGKHLRARVGLPESEP